MVKIIALFNNKGGVSKTTTTFHLGWKLAEMGYKTLIADTDPQCNLTGVCLNTEKEDKLLNFYKENNYNSGWFRGGGIWNHACLICWVWWCNSCRFVAGYF